MGPSILKILKSLEGVLDVLVHLLTVLPGHLSHIDYELASHEHHKEIETFSPSLYESRLGIPDPPTQKMRDAQERKSPKPPLTCIPGGPE